MTTPRHQRPTRLPRFYFGTPYYPEHWTPQDMEHDAERMAAAGMNVVRMAEFAWDVLEPRPGEFHFELFDETIARLARHGIQTILCTPTATPPRWLTAAHEDWMRVDANGRRMAHGSRQHCCTNHAAFRAESERITRAMAGHFAQNPGVIGWQTDNEIFCHFSDCYCPSCQVAFRRWLERQYGTIAELNRAWGTRFWALTFDAFDQITLPYPDRPTFPNPSQWLDFRRFLSAGIAEFQQAQVEILRAAQPGWWITHNGTFEHVDHWNFAAPLDFYGVDIYPGFKEQPGQFHWASMKAQEARAASGGFIVPEQQGGAGGQRPYLHETPAPGQMRLWAYQSIAHGADALLHFRWRTCRFGAEMYWNGILDHDNVPRRRYREFAREGEELGRIGSKILGTVQEVRVAVLTQYDQDAAHDSLQLGLPSPDAQRKAAFAELLRRHLPVGLVDASDAFDGLEVILMPGFLLMDEDFAARLRAFVERGGVLIATARTATRNRENHVIAQTPPGLLADLFGVTVEEFGRLGTPLLEMAPSAADRIPAGAAYEILQPREGAEVLARWSPTADGSPHAAPGTAALTLHRVGGGLAIYAGSFLTETSAPGLLEAVLAHAKVRPLAQADPLVEITCRHAAGRRLLFVLNHTASPARVSGLPCGTELLGEKPCEGAWTLEPYGVAVIETAES